MLSLPDSVLRRSLELVQHQMTLPSALRASTKVAVHHASGGGSLWARNCLPLLARSMHTPQEPEVIDICFKALFEFTPRPLMSRFANNVTTGLQRGWDPAFAVGAALLKQDRQRVLATTLARWCQLARTLYTPAQVRQHMPPPGFLTEFPQVALGTLARWVASRVQYVKDIQKWGQPDFWQPPGLTLAIGSGDCEDSALVVWSAAPLLGLPTGRLVLGTLQGEGHAWVEFPTIQLGVEATNGEVLALIPGPATSDYEPWLHVYADGRCDMVAQTS